MNELFQSLLMLLLSHPLFIINIVDLGAQKLVGGKWTEL